MYFGVWGSLKNFTSLTIEMAGLMTALSRRSLLFKNLRRK
jgi:hypothetical protein